MREVEYSSWTQTSTYTNVSVSATVGSLSASDELFEAYLTSAVGPSATAGDVLASGVFTANTKNAVSDFTSVSLFSNLTLGAGTYYLVLFNSDTNPRSQIRWARGDTTTVDAGVTGPTEGYANINGSGSVDALHPYQSVFLGSDQTDNVFSVVGTAAVPEPSTITLLTTGVGCLLHGRRRRKV